MNSGWRITDTCMIGSVYLGYPICSIAVCIPGSGGSISPNNGRSLQILRGEQTWISYRIVSQHYCLIQILFKQLILASNPNLWSNTQEHCTESPSCVQTLLPPQFVSVNFFPLQTTYAPGWPATKQHLDWPSVSQELLRTAWQLAARRSIVPAKTEDARAMKMKIEENCILLLWLWRNNDERERVPLLIEWLTVVFQIDESSWS